MENEYARDLAGENRRSIRIILEFRSHVSSIGLKLGTARVGECQRLVSGFVATVRTVLRSFVEYELSFGLALPHVTL